MPTVRRPRPQRLLAAVGLVSLLLCVALAASSAGPASFLPGGPGSAPTGVAVAGESTHRGGMDIAGEAGEPGDVRQEAPGDGTSGDASPTPTPTPARSSVRTSPPTRTIAPRGPAQAPAPAILLGASDICVTSSIEDAEATSRLIATRSGAVFTAGDNSNEDGTAADYRDCFGTTWGEFKSRIRPAAGNHDYATARGAAYHAYFGSAAGPAARGWYGYDLANDWHVVVLNSNCEIVGCGKGSPQERWLAADLAAHRGTHIVAIWHRPRFTSGWHGDYDAVSALWEDLYAARAEIVVNGHDHHFEVFDRQDPSGAATEDGIREFVVGTGGAPPVPYVRAAPNSWMRHWGTFGILKLALFPDRYSWSFIPVAGGGWAASGTTATHE